MAPSHTVWISEVQGASARGRTMGVHRAAGRAFLFDPADIPDAQHGKTFHADILLSYDFDMSIRRNLIHGQYFFTILKNKNFGHKITFFMML